MKIIDDQDTQYRRDWESQHRSDFHTAKLCYEVWLLRYQLACMFGGADGWETRTENDFLLQLKLEKRNGVTQEQFVERQVSLAQASVNKAFEEMTPEEQERYKERVTRNSKMRWGIAIGGVETLEGIARGDL